MLKNYFLFTFLLFVFSASGQKKYYMLVGTYNNGKTAGIYVYDYNAANGSAVLVDSAATSNPSFLAVSRDQQSVYAVNEDAGKDKGGGVTKFSFNKGNGHLTKLSATSSQGDHPCYVAVDKTGKWVMAGNYSSGTATLISSGKNNELKVQRSINYNESKENQEKAKAARVHATVFSKDNRFVFIPDLGSDKIWIHKFDPVKGTLLPATPSFVRLPDSTGPRHFTFHPSDKFAYLVQEFTGTVTAYQYNNGKLKQIQSITSLPSSHTGPARSADIHVSPDGKFLYASNRDPSNTIAIFKINQKTGTLSVVGHQSTMGRTPRNFNFDPTGNFLLVANQSTDNIVVFSVDRATGLLTDTGNRIEVGKPVCVKWVGNNFKF